MGEGERGMADSRLGTSFSRSYRSRTLGRSDDRPRLPTGTVTFLFTDIEGSTRLLQELGDRYPAVRDEHAAILRRAIRDGGGVEVSSEGDSFFAAFASPAAAVRAAVAAQRSTLQPATTNERPLSGSAYRREVCRSGFRFQRGWVLAIRLEPVGRGLAVLRAPGGPVDLDRHPARGGPRFDRFERGGWALPLFAGEAATFLEHVYQRADAFLFGRRTYEIFAGSWGAMADPGGNPIWTALNAKPKYVASTTLTDPRWTDTTVLSGDVAAAVGELKAKPGGELQVHGSGALIRWLLANDLVDEMILFICPVVVGQGTRLFPDTGPDVALELVDSRSTPSGVILQVYRPTGRPQYETATT